MRRMNPIRVATCLLTILLLSLCGAAFAQVQPEVVYSDDFQSYGSPKNPAGWIDTSVGTPKPTAAGLYKTWPDPLQGNKGTNIVYGTKQSSGQPEGNNPRIGTFSTLSTKTFNANGRFEYRGRFLRTTTDTRIGFSFLSSYPEKDAYYLIGLWSVPGSSNLTMQLFGFGAGSITGTTNSNFTPAENVWYRFSIQIDDNAGATKIRARFWPESQPEPTTFTIDAQDAAATRLTTGRIGIWSAVKGAAYVDDLFAKSPVDHTAPVITFTESGRVLPANTQTEIKDVAKVDAEAKDDLSGVASVTMTLDGATYTRLTPITAEGVHTIGATATDNVGNRSTSETKILVDATPPTIALTVGGDPLPPSSLFNTPPAVDIEVKDTLTKVTHVALLNEQPYTSGTKITTPGRHTLTVTATDNVGHVTTVTATILVDLGAPTIAFIHKGVKLTSPVKFKEHPVIELEFTDDFTKPEDVKYTATLENGATWKEGEPLPTGWHTITVIATDDSGNSATASLEILIDTDAPTIVFLDGTKELSLSEIYNKDVAITIKTDDATSKLVSDTRKLNGEDFVSGTTITAERKSHALTVRVEDEAGNVTTKTLSLLLDKTPPVITFSADGKLVDDAVLQKYLADTVVTFALTDAISTVTLVEAKLDGVTFTTGDTMTKEARQALRVVAKDEAGNETTKTLNVLLDKTPPVLTFREREDVLSQTGEKPFNRTANVTITATDNLTSPLTPKAKLDGGDYTSGAAIDTDGHHVISAEVSDEAGNRTTGEVKILVDTTGPVIKFFDDTRALDPKADVEFKTKPKMVVEISDTFSTFERTLTLDGNAFTSGTVVEEGRHALVVTAEDLLGNKTTETYAFLVDVTPPVVVLRDEQSNTILPESGAIFNRKVVVVPEITDTSLRSKTMTVDGTEWTIGAPIVTEGERTVVVTAIDELDWSTSVTTKFTIDMTPPVVTVLEGTGTAATELQNGASFTRNVVINATSVDITPPVQYSATIDGEAYTLGNEYSREGTHTLVLNAIDQAKNAAAPITLQFHIDKNKPEVKVFETFETKQVFANNAKFRRDIRIDVEVTSATATNTVITIDGQIYNEGDLYTIQGEHVLRVEATNLAKLTTAIEIKFLLDKEPPTLELFAEQGKVFTNGLTFNKDITPFTVADDNLAKPPKVTVTLNGQKIDPGFVITEDKNFHTISATAEDNVGNTTSVGPFNFVLDKKPPTVTILVDGKPLKTGDKFNKAITPVIEAEDITEVKWAITLNDETYDRGDEIAEDAEYVLIVTVSDALGNQHKVDPIAFIVDKTAPVVNIVHKESGEKFEGILYDKAVTPKVLIQDLTPTNTVATRLNRETNEEVPWSTEQEISTDGHYTLKVTVTDDLGNITVHPPIEFTIDQAAPEIVVTETGEPLLTGTIFNRDARPKIVVKDTTAVDVVITLDDRTFTSETLVTEEAVHVLKVKATDDTERTTEIPPITFTVDKSDPEVTVLEHGVVLKDGALLPHNAEIFVDARDLTLKDIITKVDGQPYVRGTIITGDGPHTFDVTVTDNAGHSTTVPTIRFIIDTTAPGVRITETETGGPLETNDEFKETIAPWEHVQDISPTTTTAKLTTTPLGGVPATRDWTMRTPLADEGRHVLEVTVTDDAKHKTVVPPIAFTIDKTAPKVQVFESNVLFQTNKELNRAAELSITIEDLTKTTTVAKLTAEELGKPPVTRDITFPSTLTTDAWYKLNVTVNDALLQETQVPEIAFVVDQTPPVVLITQNGEPLVSGAAFNVPSLTPQISITDLTQTKTTATLTFVPPVGETRTAPFTFGEVLTEEGKYTLVVSVTDLLKWKTDVPAITFYIDRTPPVVKLVEGENRNDLVDGTWFNRDVVPYAQITDTTETRVTATLNDQPYVMGTPVTEEREHKLVVRVTDAVELSIDVPPVTFTIDRKPPDITITFPAADAVVGTPQVIVVGGSDDAVSVAVNDIPATIDPAKKEYATNAAVELIEGENTLVAFGVDRAGNNATITQTVRLDTRAPELTVTSPAANACLSVNEVTVAGRVADAALASVKVSAGADPVDATLSADKKSFTAILPTPNEGKIVIRIEAKDASGHTSTATIPVTIDRTKPALEVTESGHPFTATLVNRVLALYVRAKDADPSATVAVTLDDQPYTNGTPIVADKTYTLRAKATDCAGRVSDELVLQFTIDRRPPQIVSFNPASGTSHASKPPIAGTLDEPASVVSEATGTAANGNGVHFTYGGALSEGVNHFVFLATDAAGNQSRTPYTITVDTIAPSVQITENGEAIAPDQRFNRAVTPVITSNDPSATITATLNTANFQSGTTIDADGSYTIIAKARDAMGNESATATATFRIDRSGPSIDITSPADGSSVNATTVAVTGNVGGNVKSVTVNNVIATVTGSTFTATIPLDLGSNLITAIAVDQANQSASDAVQVTRNEASLTILLTAPPDKLLTNRPTTLVAGQVLNVPNTQKVTINGTDAPFDPAGAFRRLEHPLTEGENVITASATSKAGQVTSVTATVTADFTPPVVRVLANGVDLIDGARFATSPSLTLEVTDNYPTGLTRKLTVDGEILSEGATSLTDGGHALTATARDQAGNETRVDRVFFVGAGGIGGGCSLGNFTPAQDNAVFGEVVRITGRSGGAVNVLINGKAATVADGTFCGDATLVPGRNDVTIQCADANGTPTSDSPETLVLYRYTDPEIAITSPSNGASVTANLITVSGTVGAGVDKVDVNGKQVTLAPGTQTFTVTEVPVKPGLNVFTARALTLSKRIAATSVHVKAFTAAPQISITTPLTGAETGQRSIDIGGTYANVDPSTIVVNVNGNAVPASTNALTDTSGTFTASATIGASIKSTITVTGRNAAGASDTETTDITHVSTLPFISITSPADNAYYPSTHDGVVRVTGTFGSEANLSVQVNGVLATISGNTFQADVTLPESSTGVTPLIARVTADDSRTATDSVRVTRYNAPLAVRQRFPEEYEDEQKVKHEAVNVDIGTMVVVLFNNTIDRASAQSAISVVDSKGAAVAGTVFVDRDAISFAPATPLRNSERYTATVATTLRDVSGAALTAPYSFSFNTAASAPASAPIVDDSVTTGCFSTAVISGRINTPNGQVLIDVDGVPRRVTTSATGAFRATVTFDGGSGYHLVRVREIASDNTLSSERAICYRITCAIPQVIGATLDRTQKKLSIQFSKAMDPTSLSASANGSIVIVPQGETALDGTVTMNAAGDLATVTLTSIPEKTVLLTVKKSAKDTSGTPMSADYTQSFPFSDDPNVGRGDGYINGAVYDAANGRPLASAVVEISGVTTKTTNARGRYTHPMGEGAYTITAGAPNYTTVWRQVVVPAGAGVVPIDIRVTPRGNAVTTNGSAQKLTHGTTSKLTKKVELDLAAASLPSGRSIRLTAVGGQSLAGLLPLGWSPLASAEIVVDDATTNVALPGAKLTFFIERQPVLDAQQTLTVAQYEPVRDEWRVVTAAATIESDGRVETMIPSTGNYALVYADKAPLKFPANPRAGLPLDAADNVCGTDPTQCQLAGEDFKLDPQKVLPSGVTTATLITKGDKSYPSGTAVQAFIDEQLNLADGRVLYDPPFATDLLIYRKLDGTKGVADFHLSPSAQAVGVILRDGVDRIRVVDYPGRLDRGTLIGAEGGRVPGDDGVTLEIPAGATTEPLHASVSSIAENDLAAFGTFPGFRVASGFKVTLTRASDPTQTDGTQSFAAQLLTPSRATVSVANTAMPTANAQVLIAEVLPTTPYGTTARVVALTSAVPSIDVPNMKVFATRPIVSTQLPLDGIVREGSYLVLVAEQPVAYAYGQVRVVDAAASRVRVTAGTGNPQSSILGVRDLTRIDGLFVVPVAAKPAAPFSLVPRATSTGDGATFVAASSPDADTFVNTGILQLQAQPPKLTKLEPLDNSQQEVTQPVVMQATFDVAIDPTSISGGLVLTNLNTRSVVAGTVSLQGASVVRFTPTNPISAATQYSLTVMPTLRGMNGAPFGRSAVSTFTTRAIPLNNSINRDLIKIEMPDANGRSTITGLAGAIPGGSMAVAIRRGRTFIVPYTKVASNDGSFVLDIGHEDPKDRITLADVIELQVLDKVSKGIIAMIRLTPFVKPDGRTFFASPEAEARFVSPEGIVVIVPAGAFNELTEVRLDAAPKAAFEGVPNFNQELEFIQGLDLQFTGTANKPIEVEIPIPQGFDPTGRTIILGRLGDSVRGPRIEADDLFGVKDGMLTTRETTVTANVRTVQSLAQPKPTTVKEYLLKVFSGAKYCVLDIRVPVGSGVGWAAMDGIQQGLDMFFSTLQSLYVSNFYLTAKRGRVVAPFLTNTPFYVEGVDTATGMTEFKTQYEAQPPAQPGTIQPLAPPMPNPSGPYPIFAKPFSVDIVEIPIADEEFHPIPGFRLKLNGNSSVLTVSRQNANPKSFSVVNLENGTTGSGSGYVRTLSDTKVGHRVLITSSADTVEPTREVQIVFNEAIDYDTENLENLKDFFSLEKDEAPTGSTTPDWQSVDGLVEFDVDSGDRRVTMTLPGELQRGATYRVVIQGTLADQGVGNKTIVGGTMYLPFSIRKPAGDVLGEPIELKAGVVRDLALDGNLLFVSALEAGLQVYDVSNPANLASLTPLATTDPLGATGQQWGIDIDHHGRVWTTATTSMYGVVRSFRVEDFHAGGEIEPRATAIVSWRTGIDAGMPLGTTWVTLSDRVEAIPRKMQILTQDDRWDGTASATFLDEFAENTLGATAVRTTTTGEFGVYDFIIPKSSPKFRVQRVTVENLTLGLRWSKDILIYKPEANAKITNVLLRQGDKVRVTRNHSTFGAISLFGFGVGLFDLNAIETNHWRESLPGSNFEQPGEQIMVNEARVRPECDEQKGLDGHPCPPNVLTFTPDSTVISGLDDEGNPLLNVLAIEAGKGVRSVMVQPIQGSREATGPDESPYGPLGAHVSFTEATTFTSRGITPPRDHPRLAAVRAAFSGANRRLTARFSTIARYDAVRECTDPVTGEVKPCWKSYALVSGYQFGILVLDATKPLNQDSLVDIIWVPAGAVAVRVIPGTHFATATDGHNRSLLIDLTNIDESGSIEALPTCTTTSTSPCPPFPPAELFKTVKKCLEAGPNPSDPQSFGSDDPRILWKSEKPADPEIAGSLAPVADPETGFLFKGDLTQKTFKVYSGLDPHIAIKVNLGSATLDNVTSIIPLGIQRPHAFDKYVDGFTPCENSGLDVDAPTRCRENVSMGAFRVEIALPGRMTDAIEPTIAIESERIPGAVTEQTFEPLPRAHLRQRKANGTSTERPVAATQFKLRRILDETLPNPGPLRYQKGYNRFVSPWIVAIADPRARKDYKFELQPGWGTPGFATKEEAGCFQCELPHFLKNKTPDVDYFELYTAGRFILIRPEFTGVDTSAFSGTDYDYLGEEKRLFTRITTTMADTVRASNVLTAAQNPPVATGVLQGNVFLHSGEVSVSALDMDAGGRAGWNVLFDRSYRSRTIGGTPFGFGWDSSIFKRLRVLPTGDVEYRDGSGEVWLFAKNGTNYTAPKGYFLTLVRTTEGWMLIDQKRRLLFFDDYGRIVREGDEFYTNDGKGNQIRYLYNGDGRLAKIIDPSERPSDVKYYTTSDREGLVEKITDWRQPESTKRTLSYKYDAAGRLTDVAQPQFSDASGSSTLPQTRYVYDTSAAGSEQDKLELATNLKSVTLPNEYTSGAPRVTFLYGAFAPTAAPRDYVGGETWGTNETAKYEYTAGANPTAKTTDVLGQVREYKFKLPVFPPEGTAEDLPNLFRYTADRTHIDTLTERDVETVQHPFGELPSNLSATGIATSPQPRTFKFTYDEEGQVLTSTLEGVSTAGYGYTSVGGSLAGTVTTCSGVAPGDANPCESGPSAKSPSANSSIAGAVTFTYDYDGGYLKAMAANGSRVGTPEPNRGTATTTADAADQAVTTTTDYDLATGLPKLIKSSGATSTTSTASGQLEIQYPPAPPSELWKRGAPTAIVSGSTSGGDAGQTTTTYDYETQDREIVTDPNGVKTTTDYDSWRRPIRVKVEKPGETLTLNEEFSYYPSGQLKQRRRQQGGEWITTDYEYDALGRMTKATTDNVRVEGGDGSRVETVSYAQYQSGKKIVVTKPGGSTEMLELDSLGRIKATTTITESGNEEASILTRAAFDKAGNQVYSSDGRKSAVAQAFDAYGRSVKTLYSDGLVQEVDYDGWGRATDIRLKRGLSAPPFYQRHTDFTSDGKVKLVTESGDGGSRTTEHVWDNAGRTVGVAVKTGAPGDPGRVAMKRFDAAGRVQESVYGAGSVDSIAEQVTKRSFANYGTGTRAPSITLQPSLGAPAVTTTREFDALGRSDVVTVGDVAWKQEFDEAGNPVSTTLPGREFATQRQFDAIGNVKSEKLPDNSIHAYDYNASGSGTAFTDPASQTTTTKTDLLGRPTEIRYVADDTTQQIEYIGTRIKAIKDRQNRWQSFEYDERGNLEKIWDSQTPGVGNKTDELEYRDGTSRLTAWTNRDSRVEYSDFDLDGNPRKTKQIRYSNRSGLTTKTVLDEYELTHTWNGYGERVELTMPGTPTTDWTKKLTMEYDPAGNVKRVLRDGAELLTGEYHSANRPKSRTVHLMPSGCTAASCEKLVERTYGYHPQSGQLLEMSAKIGGIEVAGSRVSYEGTLQVTKSQLLGVSSNARTTRYSYDARSRLFGSVAASADDTVPPEPETPGAGAPVDDPGQGVAQEVLNTSDFRGGQARAGALDPAVRDALLALVPPLDVTAIDPPGSSATEKPGHKLGTFSRGTGPAVTFEYDGAVRKSDDRFFYNYDAKQRLIWVAEKPVSTATPIRRILYVYDGKNRLVGRTAQIVTPPTLAEPQDDWGWTTETRPDVIAADGLPAETTFVWDPVSDRLVSVFRTGASRILGDVNNDLLKQIIHGDLAYDDPLEVTTIDTTQIVVPGAPARLARLYPVFDEAAGGTLQVVLNRNGEVVARSITTDPFGGEQFELGGAAIDRISIKATKDSEGNLTNVVVSMRSTEQLAEATVESGARLAAVDGDGDVIRTASAAPAIDPDDPYTVRWTLNAAAWNALVDSSSAPAPVSLSIGATSSLRAAVWAIDVPLLAPPEWITESQPIYTDKIAMELREPLADVVAWVNGVAPGTEDIRTAFEVDALSLLGSLGTGTDTELMMAATFQAQPFVEVMTNLSYVRTRWYDSVTGTWLTPDPSGYGDSANLYAFAGGDPVNRRDPTGQCWNPLKAECRDEMKRKLETAAIYADELNKAARDTFIEFNVGVVEGVVNIATAGQYNGVKQAIKEGQVRIPKSLKEAEEVAQNIRDAQLHGVGQFVTFGTLDRSMEYLEQGGSPLKQPFVALGERIGWFDMDEGMKKMLDGDMMGAADFSAGLAKLTGTFAGVYGTGKGYVAQRAAKAKVPVPPPTPAERPVATQVADEGPFIYRGVHAKHPALPDAIQGRAVPANPNGTVTPEQHNLGGYSADSPFTSWTHSYEVALHHATKHGPGGVILRVPQGAPPPNAGWSWEASPDAWGFEEEVLLKGARDGATVIKPN